VVVFLFTTFWFFVHYANFVKKSMSNWVKIGIGLGVATALYFVFRGVAKAQAESTFDAEDLSKLTPEAKKENVCVGG
jgi:phosphotransferase system  glucose/maltose/N-acetylglucosamine-specific IIC component